MNVRGTFRGEAALPAGRGDSPHLLHFFVETQHLNFHSPFGGLAQLVERLLRKQEVTGSTPVISTKK